MSTVLQTNTLTKVYGKTAVVDHISLRLEKGDIYGLIGRNGAGKTTLMKMICGISVPTSGSYMFFGEENNKKTLARVGCLIENPALYPGMTVRDNLRFYNIRKGSGSFLIRKVYVTHWPQETSSPTVIW